jgi:hypothetical protein
MAANEDRRSQHAMRLHRGARRRVDGRLGNAGRAVFLRGFSMNIQIGAWLFAISVVSFVYGFPRNGLVFGIAWIIFVMTVFL